MIYKFEDCIGGVTEMEIIMYSEGIDFVSFCVKESGDDENYISVNINKEDVYNMIGALLLLHKKMQ